MANGDFQTTDILTQIKSNISRLKQSIETTIGSSKSTFEFEYDRVEEAADTGGATDRNLDCVGGQS